MSVTIQVGNSRSTSGTSTDEDGCGCLGCTSVLVFVCIVLPLCIWAGRYCWSLAFP